jgi:outer membrane lipoprotein SlyB
MLFLASQLAHQALPHKKEIKMNSTITNIPKSRAHPMLIIASTTVVLFSLTATAALMGWIPSSFGRAADAVTPTSVLPVAPALAAQQAAVQGPPLRIHAMPVASSHPRAEPARRAPALVCQNCGVVESVRQLTARGDGSGLGAAGGAVVGGLLGNQVGGGHGKEAMTVVGAIGGAFAGNQIEKRARSTLSYETTVRMNNGSSRTVVQAAAPEWRDGDHVKIVDGAVRMNG